MRPIFALTQNPQRPIILSLTSFDGCVSVEAGSPITYPVFTGACHLQATEMPAPSRWAFPVCVPSTGFPQHLHRTFIPEPGHRCGTRADGSCTIPSRSVTPCICSSVNSPRGFTRREVGVIARSKNARPEDTSMTVARSCRFRTGSSAAVTCIGASRLVATKATASAKPSVDACKILRLQDAHVAKQDVERGVLRFDLRCERPNFGSVLDVDRSGFHPGMGSRRRVERVPAPYPESRHANPR